MQRIRMRAWQICLAENGPRNLCRPRAPRALRSDDKPSPAVFSRHKLFLFKTNLPSRNSVQKNQPGRNSEIVNPADFLNFQNGLLGNTLEFSTLKISKQIYNLKILETNAS